MNTTTTTLSTKYQIVIPQAIRSQMGLKAGATVYMQAIDDRHAIITKKPIDYVEALSGLGKDMWKKLGGGDAYLKRERASWDKKLV